jgi:predicted HicB family RNase H-like nuclease
MTARERTIPIEDVSRYTYRVTWSPEDNEYVATCVEFPSLSWLAATRYDAIAGIDALVADIIDDLVTNGESVPEPLAGRRYSGKFNLRVGPQLHRELSLEAAEAGLSLNQYVILRLSAGSM